MTTTRHRPTAAALVCAALLATTALSRVTADPIAASAEPPPRFLVTVDGKDGFIDATGTVVIEPTFKKAYPFSEGLAAVQVDGRWGYIDSNGRTVLEPRFAMAGFFSEGLADFRHELQGPIGYIDTSGRVVIEPRFDSADDFRNGVARVGMATERARLLARFADVGLTVEHHFIDRSGTPVDDPAPTFFATGAPGERILFAKGDRWGYVDAEGAEVIPAVYASATPFSEGLAAVRRGALLGYIDVGGDFRIEPRFEYALPFSGGLAGVRLDDGDWAFIDPSGEVAFDLRFDWIYGSFRDGLAEVLVNGAVGWIDRGGEWVWEPSK